MITTNKIVANAMAAQNAFVRPDIKPTQKDPGFAEGVAWSYVNEIERLVKASDKIRAEIGDAKSKYDAALKKLADLTNEYRSIKFPNNAKAVLEDYGTTSDEKSALSELLKAEKTYRSVMSY